MLGFAQADAENPPPRDSNASTATINPTMAKQVDPNGNSIDSSDPSAPRVAKPDSEHVSVSTEGGAEIAIEAQSTADMTDAKVEALTDATHDLINQNIQEQQGESRSPTEEQDSRQTVGEASSRNSNSATSSTIDGPISSSSQMPSLSLVSQPHGQGSGSGSGTDTAKKQRLKRPPLRPVHLDSKPERSILKKESAYPFVEQPARSAIFKSQWLQSTVSKLAVISGPAPPTAYTSAQPSMFRKFVNQATAATASPSSYRPSVVPYHTDRDLPSSAHASTATNSQTAGTLSAKQLKRVRFSVGQLTTEHVFHRDDAYESAEESEATVSSRSRPPVVVQPKPLLTTTEGVVIDDNIYTAKDIMNYYLVACNTREEFPIESLISQIKAAAARPSNPLLTTIDLTGEFLPRKALDPIVDVLSLEFALSQLILDGCGLTDDTLKLLLHSLLLTDTLTTLSLQDNKKVKARGLKYISVFVMKTKSLKRLNISHIPLEKSAIEFLAFALKTGRLGFGSRLEELRMDNCGIRGQSLEILAPAVREANLRYLSLRSNRIGATGAVWVGVLMRDYDDQPNKAIPNNNEEQGFRRVFPGVANPELLKRTRGVEYLDVSSNDLRQGIDYIAQVLRRNLSLKHLNLSDNNLDQSRFSVIAEALKLNIGLEGLDLSNNPLCGPSVSGINQFTSKMGFNKTLTRLCLSNTNLQSEGAIALAEFLPETRTLCQLDLTGNDAVDIAGVMALAVSIRMNRSLILLDLNVPPNDAEFARLSRDILKVCIRNMEANTGSNSGMPSPDDMPHNTIFRQPSPLPMVVPEPITSDVENARWTLLEGVARDVWLAKECVQHLERIIHNQITLHNRRLIAEGGQPNGGGGYYIPPGKREHQVDGQTQTVEIPALPLGSPQAEHYFHQCKRFQAEMKLYQPRIDNDKAQTEVTNIERRLNVAIETYKEWFSLPSLPAQMVGTRTHSLGPNSSKEGVDASGDVTEASTVPPTLTVTDSTSILVSGDGATATIAINGGSAMVDDPSGAGSELMGLLPTSSSPPPPTPPREFVESSFSLTDESDLDEEDGDFETLEDVRRRSKEINQRLADELHLGESYGLEDDDDDDDDDDAIADQVKSRTNGLKGLNISTAASSMLTAGNNSMSSPLEKLRKQAEEEEGEILLRRGQEKEDELETELTGDDLKRQILGDYVPSS